MLVEVDRLQVTLEQLDRRLEAVDDLGRLRGEIREYLRESKSVA